MPSTVGSTQVNDLLTALRAAGADPDALASEVGLSAMPLEDPTLRLPSSHLTALLEAASRSLQDPLAGLHAGARVETRGPLFYLLLSSPRVSQGLRLLTRFARVPLDTQNLEVSLHDGIVDLMIDPGDPEILQSHHAVDYIVCANLSTLRRAVPGFRLLQVDLTHAELGIPGETARVFGCPVRFGCSRSALRFPDSTLHAVPAGASPSILAQIEKFASALFDQVNSTGIEARVADAVRALLSAGLAADRPGVAKRLHVSQRTLQRQLERESTTFQAVRDGVRLEVSRALLANRRLKVESIAQSVGFAEVGSFSRAFTRWSGFSPSRYRRQLERQQPAPGEQISSSF